MNLRGWRAREAACEQGEHDWQLVELYVRVPITFEGQPALGWIEARRCRWCHLGWRPITMVEVEHA